MLQVHGTALGSNTHGRVGTPEGPDFGVVLSVIQSELGSGYWMAQSALRVRGAVGQRHRSQKNRVEDPSRCMLGLLLRTFPGKEAELHHPQQHRRQVRVSCGFLWVGYLFLK